MVLDTLIAEGGCLGEAGIKGWGEALLLGKDGVEGGRIEAMVESTETIRFAGAAPPPMGNNLFSDDC